MKLIFFTLLVIPSQAGAQDKLAELSYFPRSLYREAGNKFDSMRLIWGSRLLQDFDEPKIFETSIRTVYRFTWMRSFDEKIIVRLQDADTVSLVIVKTEIRQPPVEKKVKGKGTVIEWPPLKFRTDSIVTDKQRIQEMNELIRANEIWGLANSWEASVVHDGAGWQFEIFEPGRGYKFLYRHSPSVKSQKEFRQACLFLIMLIPGVEKLNIY